MAGLFDGVYSPPRQGQWPTPQPLPGPGWMQMQPGVSGAQPAYGSDQWATQTGGPGAMLFREMARGMSGSENPLAILDPSQAGAFFSPLTIGGLAPQYQAGYAASNKSKGKK
jgi:hypothetical protein